MDGVIMATRNILNNLGQVVGQLTLPDETTEDQWTAALTPYAQEPQIPLPAPVLKTTTKTALDSISTSSSQPSTLGNMSDTPEAGTYIAWFNGSITTNGASASGKFGFYVDGVALQETIRPVSCNLQLLGGLVTISLNTIGVGTYSGTQITLNGTQTIDVRYFSTNGGTIGFGERVMTLIKVG